MKKVGHEIQFERSHITLARPRRIASKEASGCTAEPSVKAGNELKKGGHEIQLLEIVHDGAESKAESLKWPGGSKNETRESRERQRAGGKERRGIPAPGHREAP